MNKAFTSSGKEGEAERCEYNHSSDLRTMGGIWPSLARHHV